MKNLDFLLSGEEPVARQEKKEKIMDVQITQYALDRAFKYAELVCDVHNRELECIGYLITPKNSGDRIARDAYLAREQEVGGAHVELSAEDVIKAGREIDSLGHRVLGWWHSHAGFHTFHSGTDANNQMTVLNEIAPINYIREIEERKLENMEIQKLDGKLILFDKKNPRLKYEIKVGDSDLAIAGLNISEEKRTGFAYSLVVNNTKSWSIFGRKKEGKREPYAEIATREFCPDCRKTHDKSEKAKITIFPETGIMNEEEMKQEVKDRVKFWTPKYIFTGFGKGKKGKHTVYLPDDDYEDEGYGNYGYRDYYRQGLLFGKSPVKSQQSILDENNKRKKKTEIKKTPRQEKNKQEDNGRNNGTISSGEGGAWEVEDGER